MGSSAALGRGGVTANAGVLDLNSHPISVTTLSGSAGTITDTSTGANAITLTVTNSGNFNGTLADGPNGRPLALTMNGAGQLVLSGSASNYSGGTTISNGTVQVGNSAALGNGNGGVTANAGVLDLNGNPHQHHHAQRLRRVDHRQQLAHAALTTLTVTNSGSFGGTIADGAVAAASKWPCF